MLYAGRVKRVMAQTVQVARTAGVRHAAGVLARRLFRRQGNLVFEFRDHEAARADDAAVEIRPVTEADWQRYIAEGTDNGLRIDFSQAQEGATCYVAWLEGAPAGIGWRYPYGTFQRLAGYARDTVYLGDFFVPAHVRGRGIYPAMLRSMAADAAQQARLVAVEVSPSNAASIRGLVKAGFRLRGRLDLVVVGGFAVRRRWVGVNLHATSGEGR